MAVELRPLNVLCNIQCHYCYQQPQRDAGNVPRSYSMQKMKDAIEAEGGPFTLFGGEPLLMPLADLEDLWAWGLERYGSNAIQTNGTLVTPEHVALFRQYKVRVGISVDGPDELNDVRWHGTLERTRESTAKSQRAIAMLCDEGLPPSLIITLHRGNARRDTLPRLLEWVTTLSTMGIRLLRLHLLESENECIRNEWGLTLSENTAALMSFLDLERRIPTLQFDVFPEMRRLLMGNDRHTSCIWYGCDPYTTSAVRGVEGQGQRSNCGRTNKDGIDFVKAGTPGYERYVALYHTPFEAGGCRECRFFLMCKGQCPGTAISGDWRNRSEHCEVWMALFSVLEQELLSKGQLPLSLNPVRAEVERRAIEIWKTGRQVSMTGLLDELRSEGLSCSA